MNCALLGFTVLLRFSLVMPHYTPAVDLWALAVLIQRLVGGIELFPSYCGQDMAILREMILSLGKLPQRWRDRWPELEEYFDDEGKSNLRQGVLAKDCWHIY